MSRSIWVGLALAAAGLLPATVRAQSAAITASAQISTDLLSIATQADLNFQQVVPGIPKTVDPRTSPDAGHFEVHGAQGAEFLMTFTLPTDLSMGGNTMPLGFGPNTCCAVPFIVGFRAFCTLFDPGLGSFVARFPNFGPPLNRWLFWIGGTALPTPAQVPGVYSGVISMTVTYTGN